MNTVTCIIEIPKTWHLPRRTLWESTQGIVYILIQDNLYIEELLNGSSVLGTSNSLILGHFSYFSIRCLSLYYKSWVHRPFSDHKSYIFLRSFIRHFVFLRLTLYPFSLRVYKATTSIYLLIIVCFSIDCR